MAAVSGDLYAALREAGVGEECAMRAAQEVLAIARGSNTLTSAETPAPASFSDGILPYILGFATGLPAALLVLAH